MTTSERTPGFCALCIASCGCIATVEDGRFTRLDPDPSHPTGAALCAKGRAAPELTAHAERLTHPLLRTRPKGDPDPGWQRISWDDALDRIASNMRRIAARDGAASVGFSLSSPSTTAIADAYGWIRRLMNAFGSPNAFTHLDLCGWGRAFATRYAFGNATLGTAFGGAMPDLERTGCLILWGYNPSHTRLSHATAIMDAQKRGMRLLVIDPRHAGLAGKADVWLRPRPGTDGVLALGLANLMIRNGWYDRAFIAAWTNGPMLVRDDTGRMLTANDLAATGDPRHLVAWNAVRGEPSLYDPAIGRHASDPADLALEGTIRVDTRMGKVTCRPAFACHAALCARHTPEVVAATCWVPADRLEAAARLIWTARPTAYYAWSGHEQHTNVTQTARAMALLYALTGCFDAPGGNVLMPAIPTNPITGDDLPAARGMGPALGATDRPLGLARWNHVTADELYRAILDGKPYPVRGLVGFGSNMLLSDADARRGRDALAALEFFAHADLFMSPTAQLADIVLPVASPFEREALRVGFELGPDAQSHVQLRRAVVTPPGEARSDLAIVFDLATRLGLGEHFWQGDIEAAWRHQLAPSGVTLETLRAHPAGVRVPLETRFEKHALPDPAGHPQGFPTGSRRVEFHSTIFLDHGYPALAECTAPDSATHGDARFPLALTCAKPTVFLQSQLRGLPSLRRRSPDPRVTLHPDAAAARGLADGDWAEIETPSGRARARVHLHDALDPRVVVGEHGWWQGCAEAGAPAYDPLGPESASYNLLVDPVTRDPVSGTAGVRSGACEVRRLVRGT